MLNLIWFWMDNGERANLELWVVKWSSRLISFDSPIQVMGKNTSIRTVKGQEMEGMELAERAQCW